MRLFGMFLAVAPSLLPAFGATYYVSTVGNDANPGTFTAPLRHLSRAAAMAVSPGDTVIVMDGTYDNEGVVEPGFVVTLNHSGTGTNPITFAAQNRGGAVLDSGNTSTSTVCNGASSYFNLLNAAYIVIQGFVIQNACDTGFQSNNNAHDITLRWNTIQYIANRIVTDQNGRDGIYLNNNAYDFVFDGNVFHDIGRTNSQQMHLDHGIYSHSINTVVVNNLFYNMNAGWSIQFADGASNWIIANNTFAFGNAGGQSGQIMFWGNNSNMAIQDNIFYEPVNFAMNQFEANIWGVAFDHNMIYGAPGTIRLGSSGIAVGTNQFGTNPMFVNASTPPFDFTLQQGSPAIATGVPLPFVSTDINGVQRSSQGPTDLGAFTVTGPNQIRTPPIKPPQRKIPYPLPMMGPLMAAGLVAVAIYWRVKTRA